MMLNSAAPTSRLPFNDPDGHTLALMQEAPKGYTPPA